MASYTFDQDRVMITFTDPAVVNFVATHDVQTNKALFNMAMQTTMLMLPLSQCASARDTNRRMTKASLPPPKLAQQSMVQQPL